MECRVESKPLTEVTADWLVVPIAESEKFTGPLTRLDEALDGQLTRLRESGDLPGKLAEPLAIRDAPGISATRLLLIGLGPTQGLTAAGLDKALVTAARSISDKSDINVAVAAPADLGQKLAAGDYARIAAEAFNIGCVGQDLYRHPPGRFAFESITLLADSDADKQKAQAAVQKGSILGEAVNLTRELVNRPAGEIYPESFAERAGNLAVEHGLMFDVLDENRLRAEKMGSLLAVAQGSDRPPRVAVLEHSGAGEQGPTLALVGKGVTFDSGGLSIKSNDGMKTMKSDMAGAATVLGAMVAIARLKLPVNVVGYMGLVENMVSGRSYKLGDVLTARNGVTIEVLNTDAEGRLVLADVLSYAVDRGAERLIDLATLTGACVVALGEDVTGAFSNDQDWCDEVLASAAACGEDAWQLPMFDAYAELLKSDVADIKNVGGRWGGAITAAKFLQRFVSDKSWVHLDIAGPSFASANKPNREGGGTGCMVRTLVEVARRFGDSPA